MEEARGTGHRVFAIMPAIEGATLAAGTVSSAKKIANRIVAAQFVKERKPMHDGEFHAERDRCLAGLAVYSTREEAEMVAGGIQDWAESTVEEEVVESPPPAQEARKRGPIIHELTFNSKVRQRSGLAFCTGTPPLDSEVNSNLVRAGSTDWKIHHGHEGDSVMDVHVRPATIEVDEFLSIRSAHAQGSHVTIEIFRMGWYDGAGAMRVAALEGVAAKGPVWTADSENEIHGQSVEHDELASWQIPPDSQPGFHMVKVTDEQAKAVLHPFWIRSSSQETRTVLLAPELGLQCTNWWGGANGLGTWSGNSLTRFTDSKGRFPSISNRNPVPENHALNRYRPFFNSRGGDSFRAYLNLIRWLDRHGIEVDHLSDADAVQFPNRFAGYDRVLIPPSMRFWTLELHEIISQIKGGGGDILNFGSAAGTRRFALDGERILLGRRDGGGERLNNPLIHARRGGWGPGSDEAALWWTLDEEAGEIRGLRGAEWDFLDRNSLDPGDEVMELTRLDSDAVSYLIKHPTGAITYNAGTLNWNWALDGLGQHGSLEENESIQRFTKSLFDNLRESKSNHPDQLVTVVMTAYKVADLVGQSMDSILAQSHSNLELIVVDDASPDRTFEVIVEKAEEDPRVRPIRMLMNRGTYYAKNFGIAHAQGMFVTTQDADDLSHPHRISTQINQINRQPQAKVIACDYTRRDERGRLILNRGLRKRLSYQSLMWRREEVQRDLGFFDSVRAAADDEFVRRIRLVYGRAGFLHLPVSLYDALDREGSLTNDPNHAAILSTSQDDKDAHLSDPRKAYVMSYQGWHERIREGENPRMPFPLARRRFDAPDPLRILTEDDHQTITVSMASFPPRRERMLRVVSSLLPQVDRLNIYLNDYEIVPKELEDSRIHVVLSKDGAGDLRDNGKFYFLSELDHGYHFTVDDDIIYPPDYIQKLILKIEQYDRRALVGVHGVLFDQPIQRFFVGRTVYGFYREQIRDAFVNLLGTGTLGYHTDTIRFQFDEFTARGMADVFAAIQAKRLGIPMICVKREKGWLESMDPDEEEEGDTLWDEFHHADDLQTSLVKAEGDWSELEYSSEVRDWAKALLTAHQIPALVIRGFDVRKLLQIGLPGHSGPIRVGLRVIHD